MKINSKKRIIIPTLAILGLAVIAIIIFALIRPNQPDVGPTTNQSASETNQVEQTSQIKQITLPNTEPITAIDGNYIDDDHIWRLVNKSHPFNDLHYRPANLQLATVASRTDKSTDERSIRADIMPSVEALFVSAKQAGFDLQIGSGWRSYEQQNIYYSNYSRLYGQESADTFSAKPGYSEHQTGLVMDLATTDHNCYLEECFGETGAGKWLAEHSYKYGFILRYPRGKDGITDFIYEPWHFRYVGEDLAKALKESGLTLDEAEPYLTKAQSTN